MERALSNARTASTAPRFKCAAPGGTPDVRRTGSGWEPGQVQGSGFELGMSQVCTARRHLPSLG